MSAQTYEIPDYANNQKMDDHTYAVPDKGNQNATGSTDGVKKLRRLVYVLIILVVVFGCIAVAVALGISRGGDNSSDPPAQNGQSSDVCSSGPCVNQGTCTNVYPDNYVCSCVATYNGRNCEYSSPSPIPSSDACSSGPCVNQGTCVGIPPDDYVCTCVAGYCGRRCEHSFPSGSEKELNIVIGCEDNDKTVVPPVQLSCPPDGGVINVIYGNYGRTEPYSKICPYAPHVAPNEDTTCVAPGTESTIKALCDGRPSCQFAASNSLFGDPCVGTYKYAEVHFMCV